MKNIKKQEKNMDLKSIKGTVKGVFLYISEW